MHTLYWATNPVSTWLFAITLAFIAPALTAQVPLPAYTITDTGTADLYLQEEVQVYPDRTGELTIDQARADTSLPWSEYWSSDAATGHSALWFRFRLVNGTDRPARRLVDLQTEIRRGRAYLFAGDSLLRVAELGTYVASQRKDFPTTENFVDIQLPAGEATTIYVRSEYGRPILQCCHRMATLMETNRVWWTLYYRTAWDYFYFGLMLLFAGLGGVLWLLFRNAVFLAFAGLQLSFGLFFMSAHNTLVPLFYWGSPLERHDWWEVAIFAIIVFLTAFVIRYLELGRSHFRLRRWYLASAGLAAVASLIRPLMRQIAYHWTDGLVSNIVLGVWVVFTYALILRIAKKGSRPAKVLSVALLLLLVSSLIDIFTQARLLGSAWKKIYFFQLSTIPFSIIIFRDLFTGVSELQRQKEYLTEVNALKSRFFANITHEFRTPLTLMMGPLREVIRQTPAANSLALLRTAERNAERQLELVDQLLELARLDNNALHLRASPNDFAAYLRTLASAYTSLADQREITFLVNLPPAPLELYFDAERMDRVFYNLLSNAFKFTPAGGQVNLALTQDADWVEVKISDTGRGIPADLLPHIFDRFFLAGTGKGDPKGSGIGLALAREMVHLHQGKIAVKSKVDEGAVFTIRLPRGNAHLPLETIAADSLTAPRPVRAEIDRTPEPLAGTGKRGGTVLLVEDNPEMQAFTAQLLAARYTVRTADDGAQGVKAAMDDPPDLIVSDLMMPGKDGYALCRELKTNLSTSHVPIILLTARAAQTDRLTGLETGADAYLTKPFDARELLAVAGNLIQSRRLLRQRFATAITVTPSELTATSLDGDFLAAAAAFVEVRLEEADLSVDVLAAEMGMSRSSLNRKLRALVNQSSNQFIQSLRLQRSAQLLERGGLTMKEIAFKCGFSSAAYFSKLFRERFGASPSQYAAAQAIANKNTPNSPEV